MNRREALLGAAALAACSPAARAPAPAPFPMRRGVNLGNALEAPNEGEWGYRIEPAHLGAIADAGFDGVRLPVRWDAHAQAAAPYGIDPAFSGRVSQIVQECLDHGLFVQLDCHHYDALIEAPQAERTRYLSLWRQVSELYSGASDKLLFEPLNEPHGAPWSGRALAALQSEVIEVIRAANPHRTIVLGPGNWQNIGALRDWTPPAGENIAVSVHYYEPHAFTHQNAEWLGADAPRFGRAWGTEEDRRTVAAHIARAAQWGRAYGHALQLGEFGVNSALPLAQRALWTHAVREACDAHGIGWCAWDFAGAFPIWDRTRGAFVPEMLDALIN